MSKQTNIVFLSLISLIASALFVFNVREYAIDDAWITFRYAENLVAGKGFVYNEGEPVLGTSTPLYTLLLSGIRLAGVNVAFAARLIGFAFLLVTVWTVYLYGKRMQSETIGLLAALLLACMPEFHAVAAYGMETPLYTACIALTFYSYARERLVRTTVLAALCFLIRFDGLAVGFSIFIIHVLGEKKIPWKHLLLFLVISAPWLIFSYSYFGSIFPHSFLAKRQHADSHIRTWMLEWLFTRLLIVMAVLGSIVCLLRKRKPDVALFFWAISYAIAFSFSDLYGHSWYRTPLCIPLALFGATGILHATKSLALTNRGRKLATAVITVLVLLPDLYSGAARFSAGTYGDLPVEESRYRAVLWMKQHIEPDSVIATSGIGMVGYFTNNYILDTAGLVSPQVIREGGANQFFRYAIDEFRPPYVFNAINRVPDFMNKDYKVIQKWRTGDRRFPQFLLLKRTAEAD